MVRGGPVLIVITAATSLVSAGATPGSAGPVTIQRNGAWSSGVSGDETPAACRRFHLTVAQVRGFFARAERVDKRAFHHDLDMSRCYAGGTIRLADGRAAKWFIDLERRGSLTFANGTTQYSYCLSCPSPPFDEQDEETADNARMLIRAARHR